MPLHSEILNFTSPSPRPPLPAPPPLFSALMPVLDLKPDGNRLDDEQYILRLIGQVITVSLETQKIVAGLPVVGFE